MKRQLTLLALTALAALALISLGLTLPAPARAEGATQISGIGSYAETGECTDPEGQGSNFAIKMTGDLQGCHYVFIQSADCSPSGTYRETGNETFVGRYKGQ